MREALSCPIVCLTAFPGVLAVVEGGAISFDPYVERVMFGISPCHPVRGAERGDSSQHPAQERLGGYLFKDRLALCWVSPLGALADGVEVAVYGKDGILARGGRRRGRGRRHGEGWFWSGAAGLAAGLKRSQVVRPSS
ncbi:hypothetical protein OHB01_12750 [Microbispora hainanensis]|uniref:hypothetical protein n=1 Tax=Microbispora hainanensis TaxID=568844 RepID=UPI002E28C26C|nr:hypothetical protein [Microbispora hainanensis]